MKVKHRMRVLAGLGSAILVVAAAGAGTTSSQPSSGGQASAAGGSAAASAPTSADSTGIRLAVSSAKPVAGTVPQAVQDFQASVGDVAGAPGVKAFQAGGEERPRGAREAALFREWAPAVILVAVSDGLGSGAVIDKEHRLAVTNRHVVGNNTQVSVIFKPQGEADAQDQTAYRAEVVKVDEVADLAVIRISEIPAYVPEIKLGSMASLEVGSDVHAIGHPTGEAWSYTGGIVSQIRHNYEWDADDGLKHRATVIQTQTPLNPGNSGGPLLDDGGALVGINSFIRAQAEGLNFAVSVDDVRNLLAMQGSRLEGPAAEPQAKGQPPGKGKGPGAGGMPPKGKGGAGPCGKERRPVDTDNDGKPDAFGIDEDCDGQVELLLVDSDGDGKIDTVYGDRNGDGQTDFKALDKDGDGELDVFFLDEDGDGNADLVGTDRDGDGEPDGYRKM